jgi:hypothetical protein
MAIADAIEAHLDELDELHRKWLAPHIDDWRICGEIRQMTVRQAFQ